MTGRSVSSFDLLGTGPAERQPSVDEPVSKGSVLGFTGSFGNSRFPGPRPRGAESVCRGRAVESALEKMLPGESEEAALEGALRNPARAVGAGRPGRFPLPRSFIGGAVHAQSL